MKRVLCIVSSLNAGGAETFLMKIRRSIDKENYQLDFCVMSDVIGVYEPEVKANGGRIFRTAPKTKNPLKCFLDIRRIVKENNYEYVMRVNQHSLSVIDLLAAKAGGAKRLIMRSSNAGTTSRLSGALHKIFMFLPKTVPNVKIAPSTEAAEFTFGKGSVQKGKAFILHNGLDYDAYKFDLSVREAVRSELGVSGLLLGHVGRFSKQKNHTFLLDVFKSVAELDSGARLVLVGCGELEGEIKEKVSRLGLEENVIFLGRRSDVPALMSAFDVLALPSLYEGMPNVIIEAQAAGLPCVISDTITPEADITGLVKYMPLSEACEKWARAIVESAKTERIDTRGFFERERYNTTQVTERFTELIFEGESK